MNKWVIVHIWLSHVTHVNATYRDAIPLDGSRASVGRDWQNRAKADKCIWDRRLLSHCPSHQPLDLRRCQVSQEHLGLLCRSLMQVSYASLFCGTVLQVSFAGLFCGTVLQVSCQLFSSVLQVSFAGLFWEMEGSYLCVNSIDHLMYGGRCQMFVVRCSNIT